jgi:hypothetical protein
MLKTVLKDIFRRAPADLNGNSSRERSGMSADTVDALSDAARDIGARLRSVSDRSWGQIVASTIRLLDFELESHPRYGDPKRLLRYAFQVCSQNGEDGMIHEIFRRIGRESRIFVEIGVGDGSVCNTAFLLSQGWTGYWLDGNDTFLETLKDRADLGGGCLKHSVAHVSRENIATLLEELKVPTEFDLLSLDVDQNTYYVWDGLKRFRPRAVVVEYNAAIPPDVDWKVHYDPNRTWDESQNFGASLLAFEALGTQLGYKLVGCNFTGVNAFFVRSDLVADHFAAPLTSENHYEPPRYHLTIRRTHRSAILDRIDPRHE